MTHATLLDMCVLFVTSSVLKRNGLTQVYYMPSLQSEEKVSLCFC